MKGVYRNQAEWDAAEPDYAPEREPVEYRCARCRCDVAEIEYGEGYRFKDNHGPEHFCSGTDCATALCGSCAYENEFCPKCEE